MKIKATLLFTLFLLQACVSSPGLVETQDEVAAQASQNASSSSSTTTTSTPTTTVDYPRVSSIKRTSLASAGPTNGGVDGSTGGTVSYTVTFNEAVTNVTASDFYVSGVTTGAITIGTPTTADQEKKKRNPCPV